MNSIEHLWPHVKRNLRNKLANAPREEWTKDVFDRELEASANEVSHAVARNCVRANYQYIR